MVLPEIAGTRSPGTTIPTKFNGSAAERVTISQGKLLAQETVHKAAASHLAPILKTPEGDQQFAPFEGEFLAQGQFSKHHPVALQEHAANRLKRFRAIRCLA
jgi:hypothetical protein